MELEIPIPVRLTNNNVPLLEQIIITARKGHCYYFVPCLYRIVSITDL